MLKKKILSLSLAMACLSLLSCSDDNVSSPLAMSTINIVSSKTSLGALAEEGNVVLDCVPSTVYTNSTDWLTVTTSGNTVNFSATQNSSIESRNAKLVIKKTDNDSILVNVSQKGLVFVIKGEDLKLTSDDAYTTVYDMNSTIEPHVISCPDWVKATVSGESLTIDVDKNESGSLRSGYVKVGYADFADSILVSQYEYAKDVNGNYTFSYYDDDEEEYVDLSATINGDKMNMTVAGYELSVPVSFNAETNSISIQSGQYLGQVGTNYAYMLFLDESGKTGEQSYVASYNLTGLVTASLTDALTEEGAEFKGSAYKLVGEATPFYAMMIAQYRVIDTPSSLNKTGKTLAYMYTPRLYKKTNK